MRVRGDAGKAIQYDAAKAAGPVVRSRLRIVARELW
jgi:hypothetical protein